MKKIKNMFSRLKLFFKTRKVYDYIRYAFVLGLAILIFFYHWVAYLVLGVLFLAVIIVFFSNNRLLRLAKGNGIIYGGRGSGKGILLNHIIRKDKTKPFCNVPYRNSELLADISEYLNSIEPLQIKDFIDGKINYINKVDKFEGRNVYFDDINVYMPNWADNMLKVRYPSMPPMLAINRHLYNASCIITTQDRERPYKILKELQSDFSIKAIKTNGFGFFWQCVPILNNFVYTKYIYHELPKSADMLPFQSKGLVNSSLKHAYLTSGQATKDVYEATNGKISYGFVLQLKKNLGYDTRYFHKVVYGKTAPKK